MKPKKEKHNTGQTLAEKALAKAVKKQQSGSTPLTPADQLALQNWAKSPRMKGIKEK
jgi:hypothetical protein